MTNNPSHYDVLVIGGGINGVGIARDAAGRGLSVLLVEKGDLAQATSSASTKLIHGGLRYLEHYDFKLVKSALNERERLLRAAPHIIWPLEFILPHDQSLRPKWMIRLGLYLYDFLGSRKLLPASKGVNLRNNAAHEALNDKYIKGFSYADCWADDARLVTLCAMDARENGADIRTHTACITLQCDEDNHIWNATLRNENNGDEHIIRAKSVINAAGPWARRLLDDNALARDDTWHIRHSKGSHIIVPKLYDGDHAYLLQQSDKRIIFTIPYEHDFTLIGTTDTLIDDQNGAALNDLKIDDQEIEYLCTAASKSFKTPITKEMIIWSYSGVRGLLDSGDQTLSEVTRDYKLGLETAWGAPLLNIFGGKLTTFRKLSEQATSIICNALHHDAAPWTQNATLPGGDIADANFAAFLQSQRAAYPFLDDALLYRYARSYGTRMDALLNGTTAISDLGAHLGDGIYAAELRYVMTAEWVQNADDFLWRRSKCGLHISGETRDNVATFINNTPPEERV